MRTRSSAAARRPATTVDATSLYPQLKRVLSSCVQAPSWVLDDAAQTAWIQLLDAPHPVAPEHALGWLATTARREALRLMRFEAAETPLDQPVTAVQSGAPLCAATQPPLPPAIAELRERLRRIDRLPMRQRRMIWLQAAGYDYEEIAENSGETLRSVERQLRLAKKRIGARRRISDESKRRRSEAPERRRGEAPERRRGEAPARQVTAA